MQIIMRKVKDLTPYEKNAKKHDAKQIANVANSIKRFGWQQPLVIDENGVVVIGHCRLLAAKKLGLTEVPCTVASGLTDEEIRELRIADNKTNESPWDFDLLEDDLQGLDFEGFEFDFGISQERDIGYGTEFTLPEGERETCCTMSFSLSQEQKAVIENAIEGMKQTREFKEYRGENSNSNGNALYLLVVKAWER